MIPLDRLRRVLPFAVALVLAACGGGGTADLGGGIGGTGIVIGEITELGSIYVNGVHIDPSTASIVEDDLPATVADLEVGMVVEVEGDISGGAGTATRVEIDEVVKGPVQAKPDAATLVVLGQTVRVLDTTVFDDSIVPASTAGVLVGDLLEVHGFVVSPGVVEATRLERKAPLLLYSVEGICSAVDPDANTCVIGALTIDYDGADVSDLPGGDPFVGQYVEAKGAPALDGLGRLEAAKVESKGPEVEDADEAEVEGFVTAVLSPSTFVVGSVTVQTGPMTRFEGGLPTDVVPGVKVEAEGTLAGGVLSAVTVSFRAAIKLESDVATVGAGSLTLVGLPGVTVQVDGFTEIDSPGGTLGDFSAGSHVRVRGRVAAGSTVIATQLELRSADDAIELQGPVDAAPAPSDPTFSILGVLVDTTGIGDADFHNADEAPIGRAAFFAAVVGGDLVKVEGKLVGSVPAWDEVEFED